MYAPIPDEPPIKKFKAKQNIPCLTSYKTNPDRSYWDSWPKLGSGKGQNIKSKINPEVLRI